MGQEFWSRQSVCSYEFYKWHCIYYCPKEISFLDLMPLKCCVLENWKTAESLFQGQLFQYVYKSYRNMALQVH